MAQGRVVRATPGKFWTAGADADSRCDVMVEEVEYLFAPPLHIHYYQEDSFFVLAGVLTVQIGDEVVELAEGDFASAPPGVPHTFTNTDPERTARMLNIMTPAMGSGEMIAALKSSPDRANLEPQLQHRLESNGKHVGPSLPERLGLG